jgi:hypothetical protein
MRWAGEREPGVHAISVSVRNSKLDEVTKCLIRCALTAQERCKHRHRHGTLRLGDPLFDGVPFRR